MKKINIAISVITIGALIYKLATFKIGPCSPELEDKFSRMRR